MKRYLIMVVVLLASRFVPAYSQEALHPTGYDINCSWELSDTSMNVGDTVTILRTLINHESFALSSLYFSETLPPELEIVSYSLTINGNILPCLFQDSLPDLIISGYSSYYWVIDSPHDEDSVARIVDAGDSVSLTILLTTSEPWGHQLPLHTTIFAGSGTGFFATGEPGWLGGDSCCVGLTGNADCDPSQIVDIGDVTMYISNLFITLLPFCCEIEADIDYSGTIDIGDLTLLITALYITLDPLPECP